MKCLKDLKKLKGFWIHPSYGGGLEHKERFGKKQPDESVLVTLAELEQKYGKLEAIEDFCTTNDEECYFNLYFKDFVVYLHEYDGQESLPQIRRNPSNKAELNTVEVVFT